MSDQKRLGTAPEIALRKELFARGLRYRIGVRVPSLPRRSIDIAFPGKKVAVFVDGCFWHGCPDHCIPPKNNAQWWAAKLARNRERDRETTAALHELGWLVIRVWEHETLENAVQRVVTNLTFPEGP